MRNSEIELLDRWGQDHPCERLLDVGTCKCTESFVCMCTI